MVRPLMRGGVPVLKRASSKPSRASAWLMPALVGSPMRPPGKRGFADVQQPPHEGAGAEDDGPGAIHRAAGHARTPAMRDGPLRSRKLPFPLPSPLSPLLSPLFDEQVFHRFLPQREPRLRFEDSSDFLLIGPFVGLGAGAVHGGALAAIEHAELDAGGVDGQAHGAAEGVDFADDLPLAHAADGRIAAHLGDGVEIAGQQRGLAPIRAAASAASAPACPPPITRTSKSWERPLILRIVPGIRRCKATIGGVNRPYSRRGLHGH